jgi:hypothetical protein
MTEQQTWEQQLWDKFQRACPIISRIPFLRGWAYKHFVKGYFNVKLQSGLKCIEDQYGFLNDK